MKVKNVRIRSLVILLVITLSSFPISYLFPINTSNYSKDSNNMKDMQPLVEISDSLASDNTLTGIGAPWNVTHYANMTKSNLEVSFYNNSYNANQEIKLDNGWMGYQLNSTIKNLFITRNLVNGTFHCGTDNGYQPYDNDSNDVLNWTFYENDVGSGNDMSGNYYDGIGDDTDGSDCLEIRIHGRGSTSWSYDHGDICWWTSNFNIPQDIIEEASINLAINPKYADENAGHFTFRIKVNNIIVMSRNLYSLYEQNGGNFWNIEEEEIDNIEQVFPIGVNNGNITLEFERTGGSFSGYDYSSYGVLVDNVSLVLKAKAKPTEIELKLNDQQINDVVGNIGEGYLGILGEWNGSEQSSVIANFSSSINWPLVFNDNGDLKSYKIEFDTNLTLYIKRLTPESYYKADPDLIYQGSDFIVSNNTIVNWTTYLHMEIPSGYEETNLTVEYPSDFNLTGVFFSLNPNNLSQTFIKEFGSKKIVNIPVSSITSNTNGFWKLTAVSPNYCEDMKIYNNVTGDWELTNEFLSGEYINITGKISNSALVSGYIQQTKAQLQVRFPDDSIWTSKTQIKLVDDSGMVYFDPIMIPDNVPNYKAGEYEAVIIWNNTYSSFGLNETGIIYKKFTVIHNSLLYPDQGIYFIENVIDDRTINIKVSFRDPIDGKAIENAYVYTNFSGTNEALSETSPGFYLYEFNASKANAGNNTVTIFANSSYYLNKTINIIVGVIKQTILTVETDFFTVPWKQNFTVRFNYTVKNNPLNGIDTTDIIIDEWLGNYHLTQPVIGQYELECNTSAYAALTLQSFIISIDTYKYEPQSILIRVQITELASSLDLFLDGVKKSNNDKIQVELDAFINVKVYYSDNLTGKHISNANVSVLELGKFDETNDYYNFSIDASDLGQGITVLTIYANASNYESQTIHFFVEVFEKATKPLQLYLNGVNSTSDPYINVEIFEPLNITVKYLENQTGEYIPGATIQLVGEGITFNLEEDMDLGQYNYTLNTTDFGLGVKLFNIIAQKSNYETQNIQIFVEITSRNTEIELRLDSEIKTDGSKIDVEIDDIINVTVFYRDVKNGINIPNATVQLVGRNTTLGETNNQYYISINATDLDQGITIFTIFAEKNYYEPQTIQFFIEVVERETELFLKLNGEDKDDGAMIKVEVDDTINITVYFRDGKYGTHISNATVQLLGWATLNETNNQYYNITINANNLEQGITILTIFAEKENYQPQTIRFLIEVTERASQLQLFLNGDPKTEDPVYDIQIKQFLNITVKYTDNQTGAHIPGATIQLVGEGFTFNLTDVSGQYYYNLNATVLGIGIKLFTIIAHAPNFIIKTISLRITVTRIPGTIGRADGGAQIEVDVGEDVLLKIALKDPLNNTIKNAIVTYTWAYGQGELDDPDNDGIYNATLFNVRAGVHTITIFAVAGDDYNFGPYVITLVVSTPTPSTGPNLSWLVPLLIYGFSGAILVVGTVFTLYIKRWRFPPLVRKVRKLRSKVRKGKKAKPILLSTREELISKSFQDQITQSNLEKFQPLKIDKIEKI